MSEESYVRDLVKLSSKHPHALLIAMQLVRDIAPWASDGFIELIANDGNCVVYSKMGEKIGWVNVFTNEGTIRQLDADRHSEKNDYLVDGGDVVDTPAPSKKRALDIDSDIMKTPKRILLPILLMMMNLGLL